MAEAWVVVSCKVWAAGRRSAAQSEGQASRSGTQQRVGAYQERHLHGLRGDGRSAA